MSSAARAASALTQAGRPVRPSVLPPVALASPHSHPPRQRPRPICRWAQRSGRNSPRFVSRLTVTLMTGHDRSAICLPSHRVLVCARLPLCLSAAPGTRSQECSVRRSLGTSAAPVGARPVLHNDAESEESRGYLRPPVDVPASAAHSVPEQEKKRARPPTHLRPPTGLLPTLPLYATMRQLQELPPGPDVAPVTARQVDCLD